MRIHDETSHHHARDGASTHYSTSAIIHPGDGRTFAFGLAEGMFKIGGEDSDGRFAVGQMPSIPPRTLAAPLHRHNNEEEYAYVVSGTMGTMAGEEVVTATPGTWLIKPRGQWHTFWNAGDEPCHIIESSHRPVLNRTSMR